MKKTVISYLIISILFLAFSCSSPSESPLEHSITEGFWRQSFSSISTETITVTGAPLNHMGIIYVDASLNSYTTEFSLTTLDETNHHIQTTCSSTTGPASRPWVISQTFFFTYKIENDQLFFECSTTDYPAVPSDSWVYGPYDWYESGGNS